MFVNVFDCAGVCEMSRLTIHSVSLSVAYAELEPNYCQMWCLVRTSRLSGPGVRAW